MGVPLRELDPVTNADDIAPISCADILNQRGRPVELFTPALLITHGRFDRDPVVEFNALFPPPSADLKPFAMDLKKDSEQFFSGLGVAHIPTRPRPINFDKRLYAIDSTRAEECFGFIGGIAFSDPKTGYYAQTCSYDITIPDPTSRTFQSLRVKVFGVVAGDFIALLHERPLQPALAVKSNIAGAAKSALLRQYGIFGVFDGVDPLQNRE